MAQCSPYPLSAGRCGTVSLRAFCLVHDMQSCPCVIRLSGEGHGQEGPCILHSTPLTSGGPQLLAQGPEIAGTVYGRHVLYPNNGSSSTCAQVHLPTAYLR